MIVSKGRTGAQMWPSVNLPVSSWEREWARAAERVGSWRQQGAVLGRQVDLAGGSSEPRDAVWSTVFKGR